MIRLRRLQHKLILFVLLPVAVLTAAMGGVGYFWIKDRLVAQWQDATLLRLGRAAHNVDMRLAHLKDWIQAYAEAVGQTHFYRTGQWLLDRIRSLEGVESADISGGGKTFTPHGAMMSHGHHQPMRHMRLFIPGTGEEGFELLTSDGFIKGENTVTLQHRFESTSGRSDGQLDVSVRLTSLIQNIMDPKSWENAHVLLVDDEGRVFIRGQAGKALPLPVPDNTLGALLVEEIRDSASGTTIRDFAGWSGEWFIGYYRLHEAPWLLAVIAPTREILHPIGSFTRYDTFSILVLILMILFIIRGTTRGTVANIHEVSRAARRVVQGNLGNHLVARSRDEVGELIESFNAMTDHLKERLQLKKDLSLAQEVQRSLLRQAGFQADGLDVAGQSISCDETGGDFYDFYGTLNDTKDQAVGAVGDVSGHGVAAALLMATARGLLRGRVANCGKYADIVTDINRLLCSDTSETHDFITLFLLGIDLCRNELEWVRAGHEPAILYDPVSDHFEMLEGAGTAMGVDASIRYHASRRPKPLPGQVLLLCTDGVFESRNPEDEMFGASRLKDSIRKSYRETACEIVTRIQENLGRFT
ncbi:MAG: SpoIIE family protein phosphatase, partial [Planctomycetales bacterium]|nr:SpoIIE family protein phosphatase [Planctomycetales bacterium]